MFLRNIFCAIMGSFLLQVASAQPPVGNWREHLPYFQAKQVATAGTKIFCATPYSLFTINLSTNEIERFSKVNGLSETGISAMQADAQSGKLLIAYTNSNLDVLDKNRITNINAVKLKNVAGDKTVYSIFFYQNKAYLSTGLGIIVVDITRYEIKDTYVLGSSGQTVKVNSVASDGLYLYAASDEGLKRAPLDNQNLSDFRNWQPLNTGLQAGACRQVLYVNGKVIVQKADSLYLLTGTSSAYLYADGWTMTSVNASSDKIMLNERRGAGESRVAVLTADGSVVNTLQQPDIIQNPQQSILLQNDYWIADLNAGLIQFSSNKYTHYQPPSPFSIATGEMITAENSIWAAAGSVTADWKGTSSKAGIYQFTGNQWTNYNNTTYPSLDSVYDIISMAPDPADESVWAGSFGMGLLQLRPDKTILFFKKDFLEPALSDATSYRAGGLAFDSDNNLWIANYGAEHCVAVRKADGSWRRFSVPFTLTGNAVSQVLVDDYNQKWIVSPNGNGLLCYNHGVSIDNTGDDTWKFYRTGSGNGNLPDNNVLCIAKDKSGFIWVGTKKGIGIVQCAQQVFNGTGCDAILPVVQQDNFAGYLFSSEEVQAIATDGADRKWIGTKNGAWLVSPDGDKTISRFTAENSPLLDNDVKKMAVDPATGEVFFATAKGICSYRGTATDGTPANGNVLVFPNPVPPAYTGTIAIRGLANDAIVKITEMNGRLVYQTRAAGGQATWNGLDYQGRKISSGVYLVIVSDDDRKENIATKIVFIR